jgi:hypothetical protein
LSSANAFIFLHSSAVLKISLNTTFVLSAATSSKVATTLLGLSDRFISFWKLAVSLKCLPLTEKSFVGVGYLEISASLLHLS